MPTIFSHAIFAVLIGNAGLKKSVTYWFWILTAVCAMIPDADVIGFSFGVPYGSMFSDIAVLRIRLFLRFCSGSLIAFIVYKFLQTGISLLKLIYLFFTCDIFASVSRYADQRRFGRCVVCAVLRTKDFSFRFVQLKFHRSVSVFSAIAVWALFSAK